MKGAIEMRDLRGMTLEVTITREFKIRQSIALALIRLAARVLRCGVEVKRG